ncbi:hypothetical protein C5167_041050, partial [Papaver somniferum]
WISHSLEITKTTTKQYDLSSHGFNLMDSTHISTSPVQSLIVMEPNEILFSPSVVDTAVPDNIIPDRVEYALVYESRRKRIQI